METFLWSGRTSLPFAGQSSHFILEQQLFVVLVMVLCELYAQPTTYGLAVSSFLSQLESIPSSHLARFTMYGAARHMLVLGHSAQRTYNENTIYIYIYCLISTAFCKNILAKPKSYTLPFIAIRDIDVNTWINLQLATLWVRAGWWAEKEFQQWRETMDSICFWVVQYWIFPFFRAKSRHFGTTMGCALSTHSPKFITLFVIPFSQLNWIKCCPMNNGDTVVKGTEFHTKMEKPFLLLLPSSIKTSIWTLHQVPHSSLPSKRRNAFPDFTAHGWKSCHWLFCCSAQEPPNHWLDPRG